MATSKMHQSQEKQQNRKKNEIYLHRPCKCTKIELMYPVLLVI